MSDSEVIRWMQQPYDSTFKALLDDQTVAMLSFFLAMRVIEAQELKESLFKQDTVQPALRVDAPYLVKNHDWERTGSYVAHIELETNPTAEVPKRLLQYLGLLYRKYDFPIIQAVVCPFACTTLPVSPLRISFDKRQRTEHHYQVMALWQHSVFELLEPRWTELYALLPTMKGATAELLIPALGQMRDLYRGQDSRFYHHALWFDTFLRRTTTVTQEDKERIRQAMYEYESLLDEGYFVQKRVAQAKALGEALGEARGEARGLQETLVTIIELRFPALVGMVQQKASQFKEPQVLKVLVQGLKIAPNEEAARLLLDAAA